MPLLQGLAQLLEFLSNWFNVTLGGKLLEHQKKWLEPEKLMQNQTAWKAGEEPKFATTIVELFHLLPPAAGKFLDDLVVLKMELEAALPQGKVYNDSNRPYHLPLTKFLNRYASEAVDYNRVFVMDAKQVHLLKRSQALDGITIMAEVARQI